MDPDQPGRRAAPANRRYVFVKTCVNDHGRFAKGDKARGAFSPALVASYLAAGILKEMKDPTHGRH
jgi:hypothetical protein